MREYGVFDAGIKLLARTQPGYWTRIKAMRALGLAPKEWMKDVPRKWVHVTRLLHTHEDILHSCIPLLH